MPSTSDSRRTRLVCLAGFMGSGKSTIGQLLARQAGHRFIDLDTRIEERSGLSIREFFERQGEARFRELEHETLLLILGEIAEKGQPAVLALGGGTYARPGNQAALREQGAAVVWLDCPVDELFARCATITNRPLFRDEASFRELFLQRLPSYQMAEHRVESTGDPRNVVSQILSLQLFERVSA
ncbi:MAG: shikimate kinase [Acidipila sp.]|nr:shikimate kinase [Acidipila sp.]